jgi:hypothetical protein
MDRLEGIELEKYELPPGTKMELGIKGMHP